MSAEVLQKSQRPMAQRKRKFWGWGYEDQEPNAEEKGSLAELLKHRFNLGDLEILPAPRLEELALRAPRIAVPPALETFCSTAAYDRAAHSYGKSFRDTVRAFRRQYPNPPDVVAFPRDEAELVRVLEWCDCAKLAVVPYGGGSSVVGGVEPPSNDTYPGVVTINLAHFDRVLEVDRASRAARIQAGVMGPALEAQLKPHGLTLRHFPQSFEFSSLGGWIATRSGGHYATLYTHIDDFVESLRVVTPTGVIESRRLPGSGAGPSPDRMFIGSEGTLGIITEAWMRLQDRPRFRAGATITFADFENGAEAVRAISQAGLYPANCRLLDRGEALNAGAGTGTDAILVLAFESADHPLEPWLQRALECVADFRGRVSAVDKMEDEAPTHSGAAGAWRRAFLRAPYLRDAMVAMGMVSDTFETAITWDRFREFHAALIEQAATAVREVCGKGSVTCRLTHAYPDGCAPYYTVLAPGRRGAELEQWDEIKGAVSDLIIKLGGTITHHHAVGRDHRPWYDRQRPERFARALQAAKQVLDPAGILNPGVLLDP